jgi:hypothetical protein
MISNDKEYCDRCNKIRDAKSEESYLDNLLKSVTNINTQQKNIRQQQVNDSDDFISTDIINKGTLSIHKIYKEQDKSGSKNQDISTIINQDIKYIEEQDDKCSKTPKDKIIKKQDDINLRRENDQDNQYGELLDKTDDLSALYQDDAESYDYENKESEMDETDEDLLALLDMITGQEESNYNDYDNNSQNVDMNSNSQDYQADNQETDNDIFAIDDLFNEEPLDFDDVLSNDETNTSSNLFGNEMPGGILSQDDTDNGLNEDETSYSNTSDDNTLNRNEAQYNKEYDDDDSDYLSEDFLNLSEFDLFNNQPDELNSNSFDDVSDSSSSPRDMSGIFSDVLSAVNSLEDEEQDLLNMIPDVSELKKEKNKERNSKTFKPEIDINVQGLEKKEGFWKKLFSKKTSDTSKITDNNNEEQDSADQENSKKSSVEKKKDKKVKKAKETKQKVKKAKETKQTKQKVKKGSKKVVESNSNEENDGTNTAKIKNKKTKIKKVKKEKLPREIVEDIDVDDEIVKINKITVAIIVTVGIAFIGFVLIGTNIYTYSLGIKNAKTNFDRQRYSEAYNDIYGLNLKDEDEIIYNKILTVMYVNKQLNSYTNYYTLEMYPEALDSLLKGLEKYDKHIGTATELGINKHLDFLKDKIIAQLDNNFKISEDEAYAINKSEDQTQYSINVINAVLEKMN